MLLSKISRESKRTKQKEDAENLQRQLPVPLQRSMELSQEKGASTWLTALPIDDHGFALHKSAFRDGLSLRYGWSLKNSLSHCSCGQPFSVEHALTCKTGGFPAVRHNEVRDITASLLTEDCHAVVTEPHLQPLSYIVSLFLTALPSPRTVLAWMLQCTGFGEAGLKRHLSMYRYLTQAPNQIVMVPYHPYIASMSKRRKGNTISEYVRLSMRHSLH